MKRIYLYLLSLCIVHCALCTRLSAITLNGVDYTIDTIQQFPAGPGATFYQLRMLKASNKAQGRLDCWLLKVDLTNPYVHMEQVLGQDKIIGVERPSAMAKRKTTSTRVFYGGTNGDFFVTQGDVGRPTGLTIVNNEFAYIPSSSTRRLGAVGENGRAMIANNMAFSGKLLLPDTTLSIKHVNYTRQENELVLYNQHNGSTTGTNQYGTELVLRLCEGSEWHTNTTVRAVVTDRQVNMGNAAIPAGQVVLSAHGTKADAVASVAVGDTITVKLSLKLDDVAQNVAQCIGGDNYALIVDNGQVEQSNFWNELHPRTAFGQNQDGTEVQMLVVDGRGVSNGCTTKVLGEIIHYYGAWRAVNWDGGGSSCLYVRPFDEMNKGSDGSERATGNAMFAVADVPAADNVITSIAPYQPIYSLPRYGIAAPKFLGYNQYGVLIDTDVQGVTLSCDPAVGQIMADGRFLASGANGGTLTASYVRPVSSDPFGIGCGMPDATCDIEVRLISSAPIAIRLDSVLRDSKHPYKVEVVGTVGNATIDLLSDALDWESLNTDIATVNEVGEVMGVANGSAQVVGTLGDFSDTILVKVEIPQASRVVYGVVDAAEYLNPERAFAVTTSSTAGFNPHFVNMECGPQPDSELDPTYICPTALDFTYKVGRAPFIQLDCASPIYSLPDTIRLSMQTDAVVSKVIVGIRTNDASSAKALTFFSTGMPQNQPAVIDIPVAATFGSDAAIFPLWLDYIKFMIDTKTTTADHSILFNGISLIYDAYEESVEDSLESLDSSSSADKYIINGQLYIRHDGHFYNALGTCIE